MVDLLAGECCLNFSSFKKSLPLDTSWSPKVICRHTLSMATHPGFSRFREFAMDSNTQSTQDKGRMHLPQPANYLLSPPEEAPIDSFSTDASPSPTQQTWSIKLPPIQLGPSPPTSPQMSSLPRLPAMSIEPQSFAAAPSDAQDPPLFAQPGSDGQAAPLFRTSTEEDVRHDLSLIHI